MTKSSPLVLVIDDDLDSRTLLELALTFAGYSVRTACNGLEALATARRELPHVILLDLSMPIMDGFAFRAAQLRDPMLAGIPAICVSGRYDAVQATRTLRLAACIGKPFDLERVIAEVRQCASV